MNWNEENSFAKEKNNGVNEDSKCALSIQEERCLKSEILLSSLVNRLQRALLLTSQLPDIQNRISDSAVAPKEDLILIYLVFLLQLHEWPIQKIADFLTIYEQVIKKRDYAYSKIHMRNILAHRWYYSDVIDRLFSFLDNGDQL